MIGSENSPNRTSIKVALVVNHFKRCLVRHASFALELDPCRWPKLLAHGPTSLLWKRAFISQRYCRAAVPVTPWLMATPINSSFLLTVSVFVHVLLFNVQRSGFLNSCMLAILPPFSLGTIASCDRRHPQLRLRGSHK